MNKITLFRSLTLIGYFGLIILITSWHLLIDPLAPEFISFTLLFQVGPLMFPLRGLLHGKPYTHAWCSYLALFYLIIGIWYAGAEADRTFGILISSFSLLFFIGAVFYARYQGKAEQESGEINQA